MKKILLSFLATAMMLMMVACGGSSKEDGAMFKAGVFEETVKAHNGDLTVEVEFTENEIKSITIKEHSESPGIADPALERIPARIIEGQTLAVDAVTGATVTGDAILVAVATAITSADGDAEYFKSKEAAKAEIQKITKDTDVVIVGAGAAGLSAAIEAAQAGADVILVEKLAMVGGSTILSGGKIQAAGTEIQKANGITDTPKAFADYLYEVGDGKISREYIDLVANGSAETIEWLEENGVAFSQQLDMVHPSVTPDRIHNPADNKGGAGIIEPLHAKAKSLGVEVLLETPATSLIQANDGAIVGINAVDSNGNEYIINAKSVILATGGYDRNAELLAEMAPEYTNGITNVGAGNVGDGLIMARDAGAEILKPGGAVGLIYDLSASQLLGYATQFGPAGLFVDTDGERFMDESEFMFTRTRRVIDNNGTTSFYYVLDSSDYTPGFDMAIKAGRMFKANTIEELAELINIDPATLRATTDRYNDIVASGKDTDFNKSSEMLKPIETGPFYASNFTLILSGTFGGPKTNIKAEVINTAGNVIDGLYAAGELASGELFAKEYPGSGAAIQCFVTFGRIAGREAAASALAK